MSIAVMLCFARSGGTILNKCLGSIPNVVMLSEVNPMGGGSSGDSNLRTVKEQAKQWYGIDIKSDDFAEGILELYEHCNNNNKHLIIRDWSYINFVPFSLNSYKCPSKFLTLEALDGKVDLKPFAFMRNSIDAWASLGARKPKKYFPHYRKFAETIIDENIPYFKYENFCEDPDNLMKEICSYIGIDYSESYKNYEAFTMANGDTQVKKGSRGTRQKAIKPLPRKRTMLKRVFQLSRNKDMIESNKLFGYSSDYYSVELEKMNLKNAIGRFFRSLKI